jgi:hypothetical protein
MRKGKEQKLLTSLCLFLARFARSASLFLLRDGKNHELSEESSSMAEKYEGFVPVRALVFFSMANFQFRAK